MISDCSTGQTVGQLKGHSGHIMSVYADSDEIIASGSADNTVRLWDLRSQRCIDAIATGDSCVASVCVNSSGNLLASGKLKQYMLYYVTWSIDSWFWFTLSFYLQSLNWNTSSLFRSSEIWVLIFISGVTNYEVKGMKQRLELMQSFRESQITISCSEFIFSFQLHTLKNFIYMYAWQNSKSRSVGMCKNKNSERNIQILA